MGRLRFKPWALDYLIESKIAITNPEEYKDKWNNIFHNDNPIWIEIGMGKGSFTIKKAELNPNFNIIGIEKFPSVQVIPVQRVEENKLENLKFISGDAINISQWFNKDTLDKIFLNFSDPWPKASHSKRRLVFHTFLNSYYDLLKPGGTVEFKTDQLPLFEFAIEQANEKTKFFIKNEIRDLHKNKENVIKTEYEEKFSNLGNKIYYLELQK